MDIYSEIASRIEPDRRSQVMWFVSEVMSSIHNVFQEEPYGLIGKVPRDVIGTLEWVRNQGKIDDDTLLNLRLKVYEIAFSGIYWTASQEILEKMKPSRSSYKSGRPFSIDLKNIDRTKHRKKLLEKLEKLVPAQSLSIPIGKDWVKGRSKRDDLSRKNYPIVRHGMAVLYNFLLPLYPKPQLKIIGTFGGVGKKTGLQKYSTQLARDIVTLLKTELVFEIKSDSKTESVCLLNDLEERDVFSAVEWENKSRRTTQESSVGKTF
jgi:hypothetical protein